MAFVAKNVAEAERALEGKALLLGIAGMVTKLVERSYRACEDDEDFDPARPSFSSALVEEQDEIEDEHEEE